MSLVSGGQHRYSQLGIIGRAETYRTAPLVIAALASASDILNRLYNGGKGKVEGCRLEVVEGGVWKSNVRTR
jgi:hypothetical protein